GDQVPVRRLLHAVPGVAEVRPGHRPLTGSDHLEGDGPPAMHPGLAQPGVSNPRNGSQFPGESEQARVPLPGAAWLRAVDRRPDSRGNPPGDGWDICILLPYGVCPTFWPPAPGDQLLFPRVEHPQRPLGGTQPGIVPAVRVGRGRDERVMRLTAPVLPVAE